MIYNLVSQVTRICENILKPSQLGTCFLFNKETFKHMQKQREEHNEPPYSTCHPASSYEQLGTQADIFSSFIEV